MKLKLYETCLTPPILHGLAACGRILRRVIDGIERMQSKALKQFLQPPISTSTAGDIVMDDIDMI